MKNLFYFLMLSLAAGAGADTFTLKDGAKLEGEVTGEMGGALLVKTRYGALTINKADIQEQLTAPAPAENIVTPDVLVASATLTAIAPSTTAAAVDISTALPETAAAPAPKLTFLTVLPSTMTRQLVYFESGVAIATETYDAGGALAAAEGTILDGTYTEYYPEGGLKTVKTMRGGKASGTLKAFYPAGALQIEAYYLSGGKEGPFKYYTENGSLLLESAYRNDQLNGWKKEYGPGGIVVSESYYADDRLAEQPKLQATASQAAAAAAEPESLITAKVTKLARGERFLFQLNGKYAGKTHLDKEFNIISQEGKIPDGAVKVFTKDGKLQKEFIFEKNAIKALRVYEPGGPLNTEYSYFENKAIKK